jgi:hypothetical protein
MVPLSSLLIALLVIQPSPAAPQSDLQSPVDTSHRASARTPHQSTGTDQYLGTWTGTWEGGGGSGGIELKLEKSDAGALSGRVSVTGEPTYKAMFKTVSFEDSAMTASYDFPPDESIEIVLTASFEADHAKGSWSAREKGSGNEAANGTWSVEKK